MKRHVLSKTAPFHTLLKKIPKRCRFERHYNLSSSPGRAENRGKRKFCSPVFTNVYPLPLSPKHQKDADHSHLHKLLPVAYHRAVKKIEGTCLSVGFFGAAAQWPPLTLSPLFYL